MDVYIDYPGRIKKIQELMNKKGIDLFLATRGKSVNYIGGGPSYPGGVWHSCPKMEKWA